jgi:hypothetical protein
MKPAFPATSRLFRVGLIAAALAWNGPLAAALVNWNVATGDWFTAGNWDPAEVPDGNDTALVNNGGTAQAAAASNISVQSFGFGSTNTAGATVSGTGQMGGNLTASLGFGLVGSVVNGANSFASGSLTVDGDLTGLSAVGRAVNGGSVATGSVFVPNGTIRILPAVPQALQVGVGFGAAGTGTVTAAAVDTSAQALISLSLGFANQGGTGIGTLNLGSGSLDVAGNSFIGVASGQGGTTAEGALTLGGLLRAQGADRTLQVGSAGGLFEAGASKASGSIVAQGIEGFRNVSIGTASAINGGLDATGDRLVGASGSVTIGAGGIVNAGTPGTLSIGIARGVLSNVQTVGPGAAVTGAASVGGNINGYDFVDIGRAEVTGSANGSLVLSNGTLTANALRIGSVELAASNANLVDGAAHAVGRLSVTDGAVVTDALSFNQIGSIQGDFVSTVPRSASGELELTRASFFGGVLELGRAGGQGSARALDNSMIDVIGLNVGSGGTGTVHLVDSRLDIRVDPTFGPGNALVGAAGGSGVIDATRSTVNITGALTVAALGGGAPNQGRVALTDSTLSVGEFVSVGGFDPDSRGELSLTNSTATVGGDFRLGANANAGQLFGEAMLELQSSLLTISGDLVMDPLAADGLETIFGIGGLTRGMGGYGAIDAEIAQLAGLLTVDFADLDPLLGFVSADFDLITAFADIGRDFDDVRFLNLTPGYYVSFYGIVPQSEGDIWRLTLSQAQVPEPGTLSLAALSLLSLAALRRRRR